MKKLDLKQHGGTYEAPQCNALVLEAGESLLNNLSEVLPTIIVTEEEDW